MRFIHYTDPKHTFLSHLHLLCPILLWSAQTHTELSHTFWWTLTVFQKACIFSFFWSHYLTPLNIPSARLLSPPALARVVVLFLSSPPYSHVSHPRTLFLLAQATSSQPVIPFPALSPSLPRSFSCDKWGCLLGAVHIYWVGERTLSVSLTLHISIPVLNRHPEPKVKIRGWTGEKK